MNVKQIWNNELVKIARQAIHILNTIELPPNPAIIFDIDNTLLHDDLTLIQPVYNIYLFALMLNIRVIAITNRYGSKYVIDETHKELKNVGINDIADFYFRRKDISNPWIFKRSARLSVLERGYKIVMSFGDQDWDIENSTGGIGIKIPIMVGDEVIYDSSWPNQEVLLSSAKEEEYLSYSSNNYSHPPMNSQPISVPYIQNEYQTVKYNNQ